MGEPLEVLIERTIEALKPRRARTRARCAGIVLKKRSCIFKKSKKRGVCMSISIILADDHPLTREGMKGYLAKEADFKIGEYADGESAWGGIQQFKPQVALL